jgi:hypothetical protein
MSRGIVRTTGHGCPGRSLAKQGQCSVTVVVDREFADAAAQLARRGRAFGWVTRPVMGLALRARLRRLSKRPAFAVGEGELPRAEKERGLVAPRTRMHRAMDQRRR